jgi:glycosyltransferase involved in cell wall biosynthesis
MLAPGNTAVLYFGDTADSIGSNRSLKIPSTEGMGISRRLRALFATFYAGYPSAVTGQMEEIVLSFLKSNNVQVVLAEFGPTGCSLMKLCSNAGIRLIVNFHGYDATVMPKKWFVRRGYRILAKYADGFVCGSMHFKRILVSLSIPPEKIHVVPCGVELDLFAGNVEKDPNLVVAVGRLTEKKAPHLAIEAFALAQAEQAALRMEIIGDGPMRSLCEKTIVRRGLEKKVTLHGARDHDFVIRTLSRASIFVQHSIIAENGDQESQGISLLEAMASGLALVVTDHNGFSETVVSGKNGYLVDEADYRKMADRIIQLVREPQRMEALGRQAKITVHKKYGTDTTLKQLRAVLRI